MSFPPHEFRAVSQPRQSRNIRADLVLIAVGALIMLVTWPDADAFHHHRDLNTLPVVLGGVMVIRGLMGRWPTGRLSQEASLAASVGILVALWLVWHLIGAQ